MLHALVRPQREVDAPGLSQQLRQTAVQLVQRVGGVRPVVLDRALDARPLPVPDRALRVARADEQHVRPLIVGPQHRHRFWLFESGQVIEGRTLAELVVHVAVAQLLVAAGEDRYGAVPPP